MKNAQHNAASAHGSNSKIARRHAAQVAPRHSGQATQSAPAYAQNQPRAQQSQTQQTQARQPQPQPHTQPISQELSQTASTSVRCDQELAVLFQQMRQVTTVDQAALAAHLYTTPEILRTFEAGEIDFFPPWAETVRIVTALAKLVGIDSEPIIERIAKHAHEPCEVSQFTQPVSQEVADQTATAEVVRTEARPQKKVNLIIPALRFALPSGRAIAVAALPFAMAFAFMLAPSLDKQNRLSGPLGNYARAGWEMLLWSSNSVRDGLRWIETDDPRSRKADKLKTNDS